MSLTLQPLTVREAHAFVLAHHRGRAPLAPPSGPIDEDGMPF